MRMNQCILGVALIQITCGLYNLFAFHVVVVIVIVKMYDVEIDLVL